MWHSMSSDLWQHQHNFRVHLAVCPRSVLNEQSPIRPTHCVLQLQVVSVHVGWWNMENTVSHHSFALVVSLRLGNDYSLNFQFRPFKCHSKGMEKGWVPPDIIKVARIKSSL